MLRLLTAVVALPGFWEYSPRIDAVVAPARGLPFVEFAAALLTGFLLVLTTNRDRFPSKNILAVGIPLRLAQSRVRECTKRP
jgi:hypothetical protein